MKTLNEYIEELSKSLSVGDIETHALIDFYMQKAYTLGFQVATLQVMEKINKQLGDALNSN